jgi:hypothetical protein
MEEEEGNAYLRLRSVLTIVLRVQLEATDRAALRSVDLEDLRAFAVSNREP